MIHFYTLDFNVCPSEEVISFFWRSVYNKIIKPLVNLSRVVKFNQKNKQPFIL